MLRIEDVQVYHWKLNPKVGVNKYTLQMSVVYPKGPSFNPSTWLTFDSCEEAVEYVKQVGIDNQNWFANNLIALVDSERKLAEEGKQIALITRKLRSGLIH